MKINYTIVAESIALEDEEPICTYSISASNCGNVLAHFSDVSLDYEFTKRIADLLNNFEVELCHFKDVIIDELNR